MKIIFSMIFILMFMKFLIMFMVSTPRSFKTMVVRGSSLLSTSLSLKWL